MYIIYPPWLFNVPSNCYRIFIPADKNERSMNMCTLHLLKGVGMDIYNVSTVSV